MTTGRDSAPATPAAAPSACTSSRSSCRPRAASSRSPVASSAAAASAYRFRRPPRPARPGKRGEVPNILLCDDHLVFAESLACLLAGRGAHVVAVTGDLDEAIGVLARG